jgi:hypothetical protein
LTTDNRIEFVVARKLRQVATKLIKNLAATFFLWLFFCASRLTFTFTCRTLVTGQQLNHLLTNTTQVGTQLDKDLCCNTFAFANEAEQDVLGADVVVTQLQCFAQ